jgi:hypothetical protein
VAEINPAAGRWRYSLSHSDGDGYYMNPPITLGVRSLVPKRNLKNGGVLFRKVILAQCRIEEWRCIHSSLVRSVFFDRKR